MRTLTRSRHVAGAAAVALALTLSACGSDDSGDSGESASSAESGTSKSGASEGEGAEDGASDGASEDGSGSTSATVDGADVDVEGWRSICARSGNGAKGSAVIMEDVSLDELEGADYEIGFISAHFDNAGDSATLTHLTLEAPAESSDDAVKLTYSEASGKDKATVTVTEEAVRVEGTATDTSQAGERSEGVPFTIDVECTDWEDLTDQGDVAPPG